jgi:hypothetical protein
VKIFLQNKVEGITYVQTPDSAEAAGLMAHNSTISRLPN